MEEISYVNVIGVISGKGGVGKTTTVANIGTSLFSDFHRKVVMIDGNPTTPDLSLHMGHYNIDKTLKEVIEQNVPIKDAMTKVSSGVEILAAPPAVGDEIEIKNLGGFLKELGGYEIVLLDSPPGLGREIGPTLAICDEVIIVTNLEIPAVTQALKAIATAKKAEVPVRGIVLNRVQRESYELSVAEVELVLDAPVIAVVPENRGVKESIAMGKPVVLSAPNSSAAKEFKRLAAFLVGMEYPPKRRGLGGWIRRIFRISVFVK